MALPYEKIFTSQIYTFLVGSNKAVFALHSAAVARMSGPLNSLVNGGMKEARSKCAWLEDVDTDTFARFSQFIYTGDYTEAAPDIAPSQPTIPREAVNNEHSNQQTTFLNRALELSDASKKRKRGCEQQTQQTPTSGAMANGDFTKLWSSFPRKKYDYVVPKRFAPSRPNGEANEDYTPVFLCHAKLYVLGDKYGIHSLRKLALYKLHDTLCRYQIYNAQIGDIVELARYTYRHTRDSVHEELRELVIQYTARNVRFFSADPKFQVLLQEPRGLARDLVRLLAPKKS